MSIAPSSDRAHPRVIGNGSGSGENNAQTQTQAIVGHTRTSSFFSFGRHKQQNSNSNSISDLGQRRVHPGPVPLQLPSDSNSNSNSSPTPTPTTHPSASSAPSALPASSSASAPPAPPPLHPEIRSIVSLTVAHAHKIYFSGPLLRRIEREANGSKPHSHPQTHPQPQPVMNSASWEQVWAQLGGTTLSVWGMKEIEEASREGREVPPSYVNITDGFVQVLGSVTIPAQQGQGQSQASQARKYTNVLTLNTAGSNLILFACPNTQSLISWAAALRLSAWEKSRLEEIYTAHLCRITLVARDVPSTLVRGRLEGWVRIRIAGQTDWKLVWMVVVEPGDDLGRVNSNNPISPPSSAGTTMTGFKKKRMSALFYRESDNHGKDKDKDKEKDKRNNAKGEGPMVLIYLSPKTKDRKKPLLTLTGVSQAFAVYPERPELITRSTLIKLEALFGQEESAGSMRGREGWVLVMPQLTGKDEQQGGVGGGSGGGGLSQAGEMLKWVIAFHDAFRLYGRPQAWNWDPRDPKGLMFGYPVGPAKDVSFVFCLFCLNDRVTYPRSCCFLTVNMRRRWIQEMIGRRRLGRG
ncbi:hypothetical protein GGU10DRAFT_276198 [Lentinula aff. detonsa]|uniref:Skg3/CAF120-like PH-like domain-containing protein n=1 Tax=Lentinula aff. detonsa TaxID=2804958 RepID=A0AA38NK77_9AGAR|nr:hypothetical protein GGU10DRAFT_276198 [Lentinula aff. detonsa]